MLKTEYEEWKELLLKQPKEKLVDMILLNMLKDHYFVRQVEDEIVVKNLTVQEMIKEYLDRVMEEMQMDIPNVDYLESISENLLETAETLQSLCEQVEICTTIIMTLDDAINHGAGFDNEDDFLLFDVIEEGSTFLMKILKEKCETLAKEEYIQLYDMLEKASKVPLSAGDIMKEAFDIMKTQEKYAS